jgi:hypothetical protein
MLHTMAAAAVSEDGMVTVGLIAAIATAVSLLPLLLLLLVVVGGGSTAVAEWRYQRCW